MPKIVTLQNEQLRVTSVPGHGIVLTEIVPLEHGTNLLWRRTAAPLHDFVEPAITRAGHDPFDESVFAGGWFGMFPTAGIPGLNDADEYMHGTFPRYAWEVQEQSSDSLTCVLNAEGMSAERRVDLSGSSVKVATHVTNVCASKRLVSFGEHPCFDREVFSGGQVTLDEKRSFIMDEVSEPGAHRFAAGQQFDWPIAALSQGGSAYANIIPGTADRTHDHICVELADPRIVLDAPRLAGEVHFTVDTAQTPYLLFWRHFMPPASPWAGDVFGMETMSTPGRTRDDARKENALSVLKPNDSLSWELEIEWKSKNF